MWKHYEADFWENLFLQLAIHLFKNSQNLAHYRIHYMKTPQGWLLRKSISPTHPPFVQKFSKIGSLPNLLYENTIRLTFEKIYLSNSTSICSKFLSAAARWLCNRFKASRGRSIFSVLQCVAACCSVLQCVAVFCSVLQCFAVCCSVLQCVEVCCSVVQYAAV